MNIQRFYFNDFHTCCCLVWDSCGAAIIDPGCSTPQEIGFVTKTVEKKGLAVEKILLTHAHFDHIFGVAELAAKYSVPVLMNPADKVIIENNGLLCSRFGMPVPDSSFTTIDIADGDRISVGNLEFEVLSTPGHTPGGVCYLCREERILFSGDTLFAGSIGRTDSPWGDYDALMKGIFEKLMVLDGDIDVIPGHGQPTSIAEERTRNPFLMPFNEPLCD